MATTGDELMSEPQEHEPDLDELRRDQLHELAGPAGTVADVLDEWVTERFGEDHRAGWEPGAHGVGHFLELLADKGYRVEPIGPVPSLADLLGPPS